jgi:putative transposase
MAQSLSRIWTHLIFSTKDRFPFLSDANVRQDVCAYLATVLRSHDCETLIVNGTGDHVHALFNLSRKHSVATIVKEIKRTSSGWLKERSPTLRKFHWQNGYGAFSVSQSHLGRVCRYIEEQERHHERKTFQDEFRNFLKKYEVKYDEKYVWD